MTERRYEKHSGLVTDYIDLTSYLVLFKQNKRIILILNSPVLFRLPGYPYRVTSSNIAIELNIN